MPSSRSLIRLPVNIPGTIDTRKMERISLERLFNCLWNMCIWKFLSILHSKYWLQHFWPPDELWQFRIKRCHFNLRFKIIQKNIFRIDLAIEKLLEELVLVLRRLRKLHWNYFHIKKSRKNAVTRLHAIRNIVSINSHLAGKKMPRQIQKCLKNESNDILFGKILEKTVCGHFYNRRSHYQAR